MCDFDSDGDGDGDIDLFSDYDEPIVPLLNDGSAARSERLLDLARQYVGA